MTASQKWLGVFLLLSCVCAQALAQPAIEPKHFASLRWRMIGPYRAGRTVGAAGVPGQPNVFYIGVNNGGVWKTTDYGHAQPILTISRPAPSARWPCRRGRAIYVGGEGCNDPTSTGDGIYKPTAARPGPTWDCATDFNSAIIVDPHNPRLFRRRP